MKAWAAGRAAAGAASALLCAAPGPASAGCGPPGWSLAAGAEHSRWQEFDAQGRPLLLEQGPLATLALALAADCAGVDWRLVVVLAAGRRDYEGWSSNGAPLATSSRVERMALGLGALAPLVGAWSAGLRLGGRQLEREIASAGAVTGYAERFSDWKAAVGLRHERAVGASWRGAAELWLGGGPGGRLALQLPHADAALLRLGPSRLLEARLALHAAGPGVMPAGWGLQWVYRREHFAAGPAQALLRQGLRVGGAAQPATRESALGLQASLAW